MDIETLMEKSGAYVISERRRYQQQALDRPKLTKPAIAISHEVGAGAVEIARELAGILGRTE
ncbi:MAG: hypothetical protein ACRED1_00365, partial [Limisphaerales bacterium]